MLAVADLDAGLESFPGALGPVLLWAIPRLHLRLDSVDRDQTAHLHRVDGAFRRCRRGPLWRLLLTIGRYALGNTDPLAAVMASRSDTVCRAAGSEPIKSVADLQKAITRANAQGRTVLVDFSAKWCVSCKEMEKYTFTDTAVKTALDHTVLLRADVTDNDADDQALLKHMGIIGPPTIAFYGLNGSKSAPTIAWWASWRRRSFCLPCAGALGG